MLITGKLLEFSLLFSKILYKTGDIKCIRLCIGTVQYFPRALGVNGNWCIYCMFMHIRYINFQCPWQYTKRLCHWWELYYVYQTCNFYTWDRFENLSQKFQMLQQKGIIIWFESSGGSLIKVYGTVQSKFECHSWCEFVS